MADDLDPPHRYQVVRLKNPDGVDITMLTEVFLNERGEVWSFLPAPVSFISMTGVDIVSELEQALTDCRAHPVLDASAPLAEPPADLMDDIRREQLQAMQPLTKSKH